MHTFYKINNLERNKQEEVICKAKDICKTWWMDKLDCSESWSRQRIEVSFEEAMSHFVDGAITTVIHRRPPSGFGGEYMEVGFGSMESPVDYFLWIIVDIEKKNQLVGDIEEM